MAEALTTAPGPLSARELWDLLSDTGMGLATIYRAIRRGLADGSLNSVELSSGGVRYEPSDRDHHHHFLCSECGRAYDLAGCVAGLKALLPQGFEMTGHDVVLFGTCASCKNAG